MMEFIQEIKEDKTIIVGAVIGTPVVMGICWLYGFLAFLN